MLYFIHVFNGLYRKFMLCDYNLYFNFYNNSFEWKMFLSKITFFESFLIINILTAPRVYLRPANKVLQGKILTFKHLLKTVLFLLNQIYTNVLKSYHILNNFLRLFFIKTIWPIYILSN